MEFAKAELADLREHRALDYATYQADRVLRRNLERMIENICNAVCDTGKIMLAQYDVPMPDTYRDIFVKLAAVGATSAGLSQRLGDAIRVRNILAHQYLDLKWEYIKGFLAPGMESVECFLRQTEDWLRADSQGS